MKNNNVYGLIYFQMHFDSVLARRLEEKFFEIVRYERFESMAQLGSHLMYGGGRFVSLRHHSFQYGDPDRTLFKLHGGYWLYIRHNLWKMMNCKHKECSYVLCFNVVTAPFPCDNIGPPYWYYIFKHLNVVLITVHGISFSTGSDTFYLETARYTPETITSEGNRVKSSLDSPLLFQHGEVITSIIKCGVKLLIHS